MPTPPTSPPPVAPSPLASPVPAPTGTLAEDVPLPPGVVAGLVLAGGEGRRMGGLDKGLLLHHGIPLALHAARRLEEQVGRVVISANRHLEDYRRFGYPVVQDAQPGFNGPLAGILAALDTLATSDAPPQFLVVVPCDTPNFPADLAVCLHRALTGSGAALALAEAGGRQHYACALLRTNLAADLAAYLAGGGRSIRGWHERFATAVVPFPDPDAFANLNTAEALERVAEATKAQETRATGE